MRIIHYCWNCCSFLVFWIYSSKLNIFSCGFQVSKNKEFYFFVFTVLLPQSVGYVVLFFAVVLSFYKKRICGWFGSSCRRWYYNIQKILVYYSSVCRVCFESVFDWEIERLSEWVIVWVVCCGCFWLRDFGLFFLIVWCDWLFRLVVFYWTVVILWERRKIMVGRCIATLPLLNPM